MNHDGYTLTEMLAALVMIGLAIGGLSQGVRVIGLIQTSAARSTQQAESLRYAQQSLSRLLVRAGPFNTGGGDARFSGTDRAFSYDCGGGRTCGAALERTLGQTSLAITRPTGPKVAVRLTGADGAQFVYGGERSSGPTWPPAATGRDRLHWLALVRTPDRTPLLSVRLWVEQSPTCQFDAIAQDCRSPTP